MNPEHIKAIDHVAVAVRDGDLAMRYYVVLTVSHDTRGSHRLTFDG